MAVRYGSRLAAVVLFGYYCANQAQVGFAQATERCVLSGAVINSATNAGIAHALVSYGGPASGFRFTDSSGAFEVQDVPCLQYSLNVSKPGFISERDLSPQFNPINGMGLAAPQNDTTEESGRRVQPAFSMVDVKPDSPPARIMLAPLSSLAGTVVDENAEPIAGVAVQAMAVKASTDGTDYVPARTARTDDRGAYSFLDLTPGDYIVRLAGEVSSTRYFSGSRLNPVHDHRGMQPVYYPSGDSPASASVLHLGPGERATADFRHATEQAFDIDGQLAGFSPGVWTQLQLFRDGDRLPLGTAYVNTSSGQFRVVDVPPGSYTLRVMQYQADPPKSLAAEAPLVVASQPIRDLVVELSAGVDIPVSVSYEAGAQSNGLFQVTLQPQHARSNARHLLIGQLSKPRGIIEGAPVVDADQSQAKVLTNVLPDRYKLMVQPFGGGGDYVASAKLGDLDVLHGEFPIGGSEAGALQITIRGDSAIVDGKVTFHGEPAKFATVYLIPAAGAGGGPKFGLCDLDGSYHIQGVAPGDYRIQAWSGAPTAADMLSGAGETLTLQAGEHRTESLEAASGSGPSNSGGFINID